MRRSKYVGMMFDNGWKCTAMGLANVQGKRAKAPGARNHYYIFERLTSDGKADKMIRLNSSEVAKVGRNEITVEALLDLREARNEKRFTRKVSYHFIDRV